MPDKPPKPGVGGQAKVLSAFMKAFTQALVGGAQHRKAVTSQVQATPDGVSRLWARNAKLFIEDDIAFRLLDIQAEIHALDPNAPLIPEQTDSFTFNILRGRMALDAASVAAMVNRYAFPPGSRGPLFDVGVELPDGHLLLTGKFRVNQLLTIGVRIMASVSVTSAGLLVLTPVEIRSGMVPLDRIMDTLGLELERMMPNSGASALRVEGRRILIDPTALMPAPKTNGRLVRAEVADERLVLSYDSGAEASDPPLIEPEAQAYMLVIGHHLLVGKIIMTDLCLQMVPLEAGAAWVEFSVPHYRWQLASGESHLKHGDELIYKVPSVASLP